MSTFLTLTSLLPSDRLAYAVEKLFFVARWIHYHQQNDALGSVLKDLGPTFTVASLDAAKAPLFHFIYGMGDFIFAMLFLMEWMRGGKVKGN